jgi:glyoxylate utilization-related uncharacterized protein
MRSKAYVIAALLTALLGSVAAARQVASGAAPGFTSVDSATIPWSQFQMPNKQNLNRKVLLRNMGNDTGVDLLWYPKGSVTPEHTHSHGHGMYIWNDSARLRVPLTVHTRFRR